MGKIASIVAAICLLSGVICGQPSGCYGNKRDNVTDTLRAYLFVKEATGQNDGYWVEKMLTSVGARKGDPWCAAFQGYIFKANGLAVPKYAARASAWFDDAHLIPNQEAVVGDLGSLYYKRLGRIGHIGMYLEPYANPTPYVKLGEGNTNDQRSREGNRAAIVIRPRAVIHSSANWIDLNETK